MQLTTMITMTIILLEGDTASRRAAEERKGKSDSPRPGSRTVEVGDAPEALGGRSLDDSSVGGRQRRIGCGASADVLVWPEQRREIILTLSPEPRKLTDVGGTCLLTAQLTCHVAYDVHVLHLHWPPPRPQSSVLITGRICRRQLCRYCFYSRPGFGVFRPGGATRCTDQGEIWQVYLANFTLIGSGVGVYGPKN